MPYPIFDITAAARAGTDKVDVLWKQIQEALQRNMLPGKSGSSPTIRMPPSIMLNNSHQLLDQMIHQTNEAIRSVQHQGDESKASEIEVARSLIEDAYGAKQVGYCVIVLQN